jgi:hypothetical protein
MTLELVRDESRPYGEYIQPVATRLVYGVEWVDRLTRFWQPGAKFDAGVAIRTRKSPAFQYVSSGGYTGASEPTCWPTTPGGTVVNGSITFTCATIDDTSLRASLQSSRWEADAGVTIIDTATDGTQVTALIDTSAATEGADYYVRNYVTLEDSEIEPAIFLIRVRSGRT